MLLRLVLDILSGIHHVRNRTYYKKEYKYCQYRRVLIFVHAYLIVLVKTASDNGKEYKLTTSVSLNNDIENIKNFYFIN